MEINSYQIYREINELGHFQICSNKHETPLVCYVSSLTVLWVGLWSVIVAFPQFPGLIPTVLFFCVISDGYTNIFY